MGPGCGCPSQHQCPAAQCGARHACGQVAAARRCPAVFGLARPGSGCRRYAPPPPSLQPGLGEVLLSLLGVLGATQQLMRATASLPPRSLRLGPWRGSGDAAAWSGALLRGAMLRRPCASGSCGAAQPSLPQSPRQVSPPPNQHACPSTLAPCCSRVQLPRCGRRRLRPAGHPHSGAVPHNRRLWRRAAQGACEQAPCSSCAGPATHRLPSTDQPASPPPTLLPLCLHAGAGGLQEQAGLWQQRGGRGSAQDLPGRPGVRAEAAWPAGGWQALIGGSCCLPKRQFHAQLPPSMG